MINGVVDNPAMKRFELALGEDVVAALYYQIEDGIFILLHTEVPFEFSGRGVGTRLVEAVFEELRRTGRKVIAKCPFAARFSVRHPEYAELVAG